MSIFTQPMTESENCNVLSERKESEVKDSSCFTNARRLENLFIIGSSSYGNLQASVLSFTFALNFPSTSSTVLHLHWFPGRITSP